MKDKKGKIISMKKLQMIKGVQNERPISAGSGIT
jgi:hypothetical protein